MNKHITYLFPSRSRKKKLLAALENIFMFSHNQNDYQIILVLDEDDEQNDKELRDYISGFKEYKVKAFYGYSKNKIHACNRELNKIMPTSDIVILMSDDFKMLMPGFDNVIRQAFEDGFKGLVHFPDGRVQNEPQKKHAVNFQIWILKNGLTAQPDGKWTNGRTIFDNLPLMYDAYFLESKQRIVTFPIMHKSYVDQFGYIYWPEYKSVCCDDEMTQVAKLLGQYRYVDKNIMVHEHYRNGFGVPDELMQHNESEEFYKHDREILSQRQQINFGL